MYLQCHHVIKHRLFVPSIILLHFIIHIYYFPSHAKTDVYTVLSHFFHMRVMNCTCILLLAVCKKRQTIQCSKEKRGTKDNDPQNTTQKSKPQYKPEGRNSCTPAGLAVPVLLVASVVVLLNDTNII